MAYGMAILREAALKFSNNPCPETENGLYATAQELSAVLREIGMEHYWRAPLEMEPCPKD